MENKTNLDLLQEGHETVRTIKKDEFYFLISNRRVEPKNLVTITVAVKKPIKKNDLVQIENIGGTVEKVLNERPHHTEGRTFQKLSIYVIINKHWRND